MQVRVRVQLPDSPGALARLAHHCGEAYVNILSVRVYPALGSVTDDLILEAPDYWSFDDVRDLVLSAGGNGVIVLESSRDDLKDEPTRWLEAALAVLEHPSRVDKVIQELIAPVTTPLHAEASRIEVLRQFVPLGAAVTSVAGLGVGDDEAESLVGRGARAAASLVRAPKRMLEELPSLPGRLTAR
jgi:hypothetical protein